jgi:branched-chain amino acid transport system substrate-binding protein
MFFGFRFLLLVLTIGTAGSALADGKLAPHPIVLGQSCALTGPSKNLGLQLRGGLLAAFAKVNDEAGGINGRELVLISKDDGYEPDRAVKNTRDLITIDQVFMLIGEVGTPTSKAVIPLIDEHRIPFFAPYTGAEFLRDPFRKYIINVRASYFQEMEKLAAYLIAKKMRRIACFYQNDSYGLTGLQGIETALRKRGMELVSKGTYERNTVAVMGGLRDIYKGEPEAVILVGTYSACAEFIKLSKNKIDRNPAFCSISFVGTESLRDTLGGYGEGVIVSQVTPLPSDVAIPLIREYREAMQKYQHDVPLSFTSLEGYIAGTLFFRIAESVSGVMTREKFITTMEQMGRYDLGGLVLQFGTADHQGFDTVHLTRIYPEIEAVRE